MAGGAQHWTTEWRRFAYVRRITSGVFYMLRTDCAWAPVVFPPRVRRLDGISVGIHAQLRELVRLHAGSDPASSAAVIGTYALDTVQMCNYVGKNSPTRPMKRARRHG